MRHLKRKFDFSYTFNDTDRELYGVEGDVVLMKEKGESLGHVLMKLVSYFLFYDPSLKIEPSLEDQHYKPDLVEMDEFEYEPVTWVECGTTSPSKLESIVSKNKRCGFWIVKESESALRSYANVTGDVSEESGRVGYLTFESPFIDDLEDSIDRRHDLVVTASEDELFLDVNGVSHQTSIHRLDVS